MLSIPAKWFHPGRLKPVRLIVIHCTVSKEMGTGAEAVAAYFASGERRASAHRVVDNNSTVLCVKDEDTAFGAAGANSDGLHLELVGLPTQSSVEWQDTYSLAELRQAAATVREWSAEFHVPLRWLTVDQVADGRSMGLCTHADVSKAFPAVSTGHWDPGPNFPKAKALELWTPPQSPPPASHQEEGMEIIHVSSGESYLVGGTNVVNLDAAELKALRASSPSKYPERTMPLSLWNKAF